MTELLFHPDVYRELNDAYQWYQSKADGLGDDFLKELDNAFALIQQLPEMWPKTGGGYRRYLLKRFPFGIIYKIQSNHVLIGAIMHLSRKPGYWRDRLV